MNKNDIANYCLPKLSKHELALTFCRFLKYDEAYMQSGFYGLLASVSSECLKSYGSHTNWCN